MTLGELLEKFCVWKINLETKGLRVIVGKTKIMVSAHNAPKQAKASKFPCGVCNKGAGSNAYALFVAFGCTNAVQTSRVLLNLTLILNVRMVEVKYETRPSQTSTLMISMVKKSKKSGIFVTSMTSLDNMVGVSMPQLPE